MNNEKTKGMEKEGKGKMKEEHHRSGSTSGQPSEKFDKQSGQSQKDVNKSQDRMKK